MDLFLFFYSFDWYEVTQTTASRLLLLISLLTHRRFYLRDYTAEFSVEDSSAQNIYQEYPASSTDCAEQRINCHN